MTYIAPIRLEREAQLKRRGGAKQCFAADPGGYRRRVERLRALEHCSKVDALRVLCLGAHAHHVENGPGPRIM
jgi:hypothetical protein